MSPGETEGALLTVVIVTYNSAYGLGEALDSVAAQLAGVPVIVVDNGSTDGSVAIASRRLGVTVIEGHGNVGFGSGVNRGMAASETPLVLVLNPDTIVANIDYTVLAEIAAHRPCGLVACAISVGGEFEEPLKVAWGWRQELLWNLWTFYLKPGWLIVRRPAAKPGQPAWIGGAAFIAAKDEWSVVGGFDEQIFLYYEDFDVSRRYQAHGLPLRGTESVLVSHARQEEKRGVAVDQVASWVFRSLLQMTAAHEGPRAARQAGVALLRGLRLIEVIGQGSRWVPWAGRYGAVKAESAARVRRLLLDEPSGSGAANHYGHANLLLADLALRMRTGRAV
jgi:GT2 family glycosyltransferase